jgi:hypothetical protein
MAITFAFFFWRRVEKSVDQVPMEKSQKIKGRGTTL